MAGVKVTRNDQSKRVMDAIAKISRYQVYVGIPQDSADNRKAALRQMAGKIQNPATKSGRKKLRQIAASLNSKVTNAELMWIQSKGSKLRHIPARPVIEPAIVAEGNKEAIAAELAGAAKATLDGKPDVALVRLKRAGMAGQRASQKWFTDARANFKPNAPSTIKAKGSDKPLIDQGILRSAITYVVKED
jgi:hypothetical protein